jgi:hypothetical protein
VVWCDVCSDLDLASACSSVGVDSRFAEAGWYNLVWLMCGVVWRGVSCQEFKGRVLKIQFAKQRRPDNAREQYRSR